MTAWLFRSALRLVPVAWRETVRNDIEDEARARRRGALWCAWQALRVAVRWRGSFGPEALMTDLRYVVRSLWHAKGFTMAAVLTLVLGLGMNIAVFTVVDRMLFRPLPFAHEGRLVMVVPYAPERGLRYNSFSKRLFVEGRRGVAAIEDMGFAGFTSAHALGAEPDAPTLALTEVSYNLLDVLGVAPVAGRGFLREDAEQKRGVVMITDESWRSRFGGAATAIGTVVRQNQTLRTIIGVLPKGFLAPASARTARFDGLFLDYTLLESAEPKETVDPGIARLAPGASLALAQQQFDALGSRLDSELGVGGRPGPRVLIESLRAGMFWRVHTYLWLVIAAASLVGLLACTNFSGLLLARGRARQGDFALRASLGASRARLMLTEVAQSLIVCGIAAGISVLALYWSAAALRGLVYAELRPLVLGAVDVRVVLYAALAAVIAAVASAVLPAWRASRSDLIGVLQRDSGPAARVRRRRAGGAVLAIEAAVGVLLVTGAAIVVRSFVGLATTDVGFQARDAYVVRVGPSGDRQGGDNLAELARYMAVLDEIRRRPGVVAAGAVDSMPSAGAAPMTGMRLANDQHLGLWQVTDGFIAALGARVVAGRDLTRTDLDAGQPVALLTPAAVALIWPGENINAVVGREFSAPKQPTRRIVGIVNDLRDRPDEAPRPRVFAPVQARDYFWYLEFAVRTDPTRFNGDALRRELVGHHGVTTVRIDPAGGMATTALEQPRAQVVIFGAFAAVALLLAALGLFAVASFDVALRRPEIGLRMALGATQREIRQLVIGDAVRPVAIGVGAGLLAAYWAARFVQTLVHETDVRDPWTLAAVAGVLLASAVLAAWLPASRASRVDPAVVLRAQ